MKVVIAGSRCITDKQYVYECIRYSCLAITEVVCGGAIGVDLLGAEWAKENNIPVKWFLPKRQPGGGYAYKKRNIEMAEYGDALIAIWDHKSNGTRHMIAQMAIRRGKPIRVYGWHGKGE